MSSLLKNKTCLVIFFQRLNSKYSLLTDIHNFNRIIQDFNAFMDCLGEYALIKAFLEAFLLPDKCLIFLIWEKEKKHRDTGLMNGWLRQNMDLFFFQKGSHNLVFMSWRSRYDSCCSSAHNFCMSGLWSIGILD